MRTSSIRNSQRFSSEAKENQTQVSPFTQDKLGDDDPMILRHSWYYVENESSRIDDRNTIDDVPSYRGSFAMKLVSMKESLLFRESAV